MPHIRWKILGKKQNTYYFASFSKNIFALSSSNRFIFTIKCKICWICKLLSGAIAFGMRNKQKNVHALYHCWLTSVKHWMALVFFEVMSNIELQFNVSKWVLIFLVWRRYCFSATFDWVENVNRQNEYFHWSELQSI